MLPLPAVRVAVGGGYRAESEEKLVFIAACILQLTMLSQFPSAHNGPPRAHPCFRVIQFGAIALL